jgi:excisionase family DNA binding protein
MKKTEIPHAISTAVVAMLSPFLPGLTAARLESMAFALEEKQHDSLLTRKESAFALRISLPTVDRLLASGELSRVNVRGRVLVRRSELDKIISGEKAKVQG